MQDLDHGPVAFEFGLYIASNRSCAGESDRVGVGAPLTLNLVLALTSEIDSRAGAGIGGASSRGVIRASTRSSGRSRAVGVAVGSGVHLQPSRSRIRTQLVGCILCTLRKPQTPQTRKHEKATEIRHLGKKSQRLTVKNERPNSPSLSISIPMHTGNEAIPDTIKRSCGPTAAFHFLEFKKVSQASA